VDFDPIPGLEHQGLRLASIDLITPGSTSGDAYLLLPDGRHIDIAWRSERAASAASWSRPTVLGGLGVITVEITGSVGDEGDLGPVLEAAARLVEPIIAVGVEGRPRPARP
jgi:hypothetical protein